MAKPNLRGFDLPFFETWGRRHDSCMSPGDDHAISTSAAFWDVGRDPNPISTPPDAAKPSPPRDDGFERMRMRLMAHLRDAADKLNLTVPKQAEEMDSHDGDKTEAAEAEPPPPPSTTALPRRRRSANRPRRDPSPPPPPQTQTRSLRLRSAARAEKEQPRDRRLSVSLSREEVDEDFYALTGRRASGRPKRRPRGVRKHLDLLFPGLGLSEITAACYEVAAPRLARR